MRDDLEPTGPVTAAEDSSWWDEAAAIALLLWLRDRMPALPKQGRALWVPARAVRAPGTGQVLRRRFGLRLRLAGGDASRAVSEALGGRWEEWLAAQVRMGRIASIHGYWWGAGTDATPRGWAREYLAEAAARREAALADTARRAALEPGSEGAISERQAAAWAERQMRGAFWAGHHIGALAYWDGPVYRHLGITDHCGSCPPKSGWYQSLRACVYHCGGLPGDGSDYCRGNCKCYLTAEV